MWRWDVGRTLDKSEKGVSANKVGRPCSEPKSPYSYVGRGRAPETPYAIPASAPPTVPPTKSLFFRSASITADDLEKFRS